MPSWPARFRRHRHEYGFRVPAGSQAELRAAIVQQIELHIAGTADELVFAFSFAPRFVHMPSYDLGIDLEKCESNLAGKREIGLPISRIVPVIEDSTHAARLAAMG